VRADGIINDIEEKGLSILIKVRESVVKKVAVKRRRTKNDADIVEYLAPAGETILFKIGDKVKKGDQLYEGPLDLREILSFRGVDAFIHYVINEVQKVYIPEGAAINDKHIEIIVKQMLSRVAVKDSGDTDFMMGEVVEKPKFVSVNRTIRKAKKQPARAIQRVFGVTRVSLTTESFLSAASFQETARVLVDAAVQHKVDVLRGLKENVIIGKLIPVGTGLRGVNQEKLAALRAKLTVQPSADNLNLPSEAQGK